MSHLSKLTAHQMSSKIPAKSSPSEALKASKDQTPTTCECYEFSCPEHKLPAIQDIRKNFLRSPVINLCIGKDSIEEASTNERQNVVYIHQHVLCLVSPYFKTCLAGPNASTYIEGQSKQITFSQDIVDEETLLLFGQWVYTLDISTLRHNWLTSKFTISKPQSTGDKTRIKPTTLQHECHYSALFDLYSFAEYILCTTLQNAIIDEIIYISETHNIIPGMKDVCRLWDMAEVDDELSAPDDTFYANGSPCTDGAISTGNEEQEEQLCSAAVSEPFKKSYFAGSNRGLIGLVLDLYAFASKSQALILTARGFWPERFLREVIVIASRRARRGQVGETGDEKSYASVQDLAWPRLKSENWRPIGRKDEGIEILKKSRCHLYHIHDEEQVNMGEGRWAN